jgi:hypothetical protein
MLWTGNSQKRYFDDSHEKQKTCLINRLKETAERERENKNLLLKLIYQ